MFVTAIHHLRLYRYCLKAGIPIHRVRVGIQTSTVSSQKLAAFSNSADRQFHADAYQ
jgi:hypothetical protein